MNLNKNCYKDNKNHFKIACELSEKIFSHNELINMLKCGNIPERQIAALCLDYVCNADEGEILISNLIGCDGKIREATALKIDELLSADNNVGAFLNYPEIFANASVDINANICRLVINSVNFMKRQPNFSKAYINIVIKFIDETFSEMNKFIYKDKKYVINKQLFKLYWCLESLKLFVNEIDPNMLLQILTRASEESEYTIREKVAQIVLEIKNSEFKPLRSKLMNDENYYVRTAFQNVTNK